MNMKYTSEHYQKLEELHQERDILERDFQLTEMAFSFYPKNFNSEHRKKLFRNMVEARKTVIKINQRIKRHHDVYHEQISDH